MADNLPPSSADVTESGSLNLPESSGPHRPVMGLLYLLPSPYLLCTCVCVAVCMCSHTYFWSHDVIWCCPSVFQYVHSDANVLCSFQLLFGLAVVIRFVVAQTVFGVASSVLCRGASSVLGCSCRLSGDVAAGQRFETAGTWCNKLLQLIQLQQLC
jgi:hypothetical protein